MTSGRTLLISRLTTQNAGNEALSKELIHYVTQNLPGSEIAALDRYPRYFEQFSLDSLGSDPVLAFEALVSKLLATCLRPDAASVGKALEDRVRLDPRGRELGGPLRRLKRSIAIRRRLATRGLIERQEPVSAVTACATADLVIWNPAGEMGAGATALDHVLRLLLLIGIAQQSGRKTAVVNHSLEVTDPRLRKLVAHVYSRCDYVGFRDPTSVEAAISMGVRPNRIVESPDLVFLAARRPGEPTPAEAPDGSIVVALNGGLEESAAADDWKRLVSGLKGFGRPLLFLSNAVNHDREFAERLAKMAGTGTVIDHQPGYQQLRGYYRNSALLVSTRLHASLLALCEGVPVVTIEPSVFKLTAIFQQIDYPIGTERIQEPGWVDRVLANAERTLRERDSLSSRISQIVKEQGTRIDTAYAPLFALLDSGVPTKLPSAAASSQLGAI
jgi:polysaccharide pyruvyl transferase WcaK-like protein